MTATTVPGRLYYPNLGPSTSNPSLSGLTTLDAAGEYMAFIFMAEEAMTISHVGLKLAGATGSPTADIRIETVDSAGLPSGTLWATNTNIVTGTLTTSWAVHALTASATIAKNDIVCVKIAYNSGTSLQTSRVSNFRPVHGLPYVVNNTGTPAKAGTDALTIGLGSSTTSFYFVPMLFPVSTATSVSFNNGTAGDRRGVRFQVPFNCTVKGLRIGKNSTAGGFKYAIFTDAGSEVSSSETTVAIDILVSGNVQAEYTFDNPATLTRNTWYRAAIEPTSATNTGFYTLTAGSADVLAGMPGADKWHYTTYTTAGNWVDTNTTIFPIMDLLISQVDDGDGTGGSSGGIVIGGE